MPPAPCIDFWSPRGLALLGAVKLLGHKLRCQARIVSGVTRVAISSNARLPSFFPISASVFRSPITEPYTPLDLFAEDPVFCHQVFVAQEEFLVHRSSHIGE